MKVISDKQVSDYLLKNVNRESLLNDLQPLIIHGLRAYLQDPSCVPNRIVSTSNTADSDATHLFMPCILPNNVGMKVVSGGPTNVQKGLGFQGVVNVLDEWTGELKAVINAKTLTAFRTALASSVALVRVVDVNNKVPIRILVFGAGPQAFWHLFLAIKLYCVNNITIVSRNLQSAQKLASEISEYVNATIVPLTLSDQEDVSKQVRQSSIVFGCTPSTEGIIRKEYLDADIGTLRFVSLIGSYKPHMTELDPNFLEEYYAKTNVNVIVDSPAHCLAEAGELIQCGIDHSRLVSIAELAEQPLTEKFATSKGVVLCKLVGILALDIVTGNYFAQHIEGIEIDNF